MGVDDKLATYRNGNHVPKGSEGAWIAVIEAGEAFKDAVKHQQHLAGSGASDHIPAHRGPGAVGQMRSEPDVDGLRAVYGMRCYELLRDHPGAAGHPTIDSMADKHIRAVLAMSSTTATQREDLLDVARRAGLKVADDTQV